MIILTTFGRPGYLRRAMESGALGFVVKDAPAEQLADAVRRVAAGQRVVDPALAAATLAGGASPLTGRERDVLVASRDGATVADIAGKLFLSEGTVRNYLSAAIAKTGVRNRVEAYARRPTARLALSSRALRRVAGQRSLDAGASDTRSAVADGRLGDADAGVGLGFARSFGAEAARYAAGPPVLPGRRDRLRAGRTSDRSGCSTSAPAPASSPRCSPAGPTR